MLNWISIIGTVIIWDKFIFPMIKIALPFTRNLGGFLNKLLGCAPCLSLWATLAITYNPFLSFASYVFTAIIIREYDKATL